MAAQTKTPLQRLCEAIANAREARFEAGEVIAGKRISRLAMGLPRRAGVALCPLTPYGIRIVGATIRGRIELDKATPGDGGPICPIELEDCVLQGGFSGAHAHFSRLSFRNCTFDDDPGGLAAEEAVPTLELSGAAIGSDLDMPGIAPVAERGGGPLAEAERPHLWVRAIGTRIDGNLELSCARLSAPIDRRDERDLSRPPILPLDLSLARIEGDFNFLGRAVSRGTISARSARIAGDAWMSGAEIVCRPGDKRALFFQLATIGGSLVLDGRREKADGKSGRFFPFKADGEVDLFAIRVGGSILLNNSDLEARPHSADAPECLCLRLTGAQVGGLVEIERREEGEPASLKGRIRFDRMVVDTVVTIDDVELGSSEPAMSAEGHCIDARVLSARHLTIRKIRPFAAATGASGQAGPDPALSINLDNARLERLTIEEAELTGPLEASPLRCDGDVVLGGTIGGKLDLEGSTIGGTLDISDVRITGDRGFLSLKDVTIGRALRLTPGARHPDARFELRGTADLTALTCDTLDDDAGRRWGRESLVRMNHLIYRRTGWMSEGRRGEAGGGRNSVYARLAQAYRSRRSSGAWPWRWLKRLPAFSRSGALRCRSREPSYKIVSDWIQSRRADGFLPWRFFPAALLSGDRDYCEPWQHRRNWIYQQYRSRHPVDPFVSIARHRIWEDDYRPQPFEQAIKVARAEGREDFATQFEIHKQYLEWRLFNRRVRWGLGLIAITLAALWLVIHTKSDARIAGTMIAYLVTVGLMIFGSAIRDVLRRHLIFPLLRVRDPDFVPDFILVAALLLVLWVSGLGIWPFATAALPVAAIGLALFGSYVWVRVVRPSGARAWNLFKIDRGSKLLTWEIYGIPAMVLLFATGWIETPFHFVVAFLIFVALRLIAVLAHQFMRFGFGYMRRPIQAVATLIFAFLVGWVGVHLANQRNMLVYDAVPAADVTGPEEHAHYPDDYTATGPVALPGSRNVATGKDVVREISCAATISEPLYALDVLIPIVDLGEESRCEVRRVQEYRESEQPGGDPQPVHHIVDPEEENLFELLAALPDLPLNDHRFWWWMKALYAIAGWVIVSLTLLTFAQVNRTRGEGAGMGE